MERPIIEAKVAAKLKKIAKGSVLFIDDFRDYGNPESVKKALLRIKEKGKLIRLTQSRKRRCVIKQTFN